MTVSEENPYQSPFTLAPSETPQPSATYASRTKAVLAGLRRGAKFGGKLMAVIMTVVVGGEWVFLTAMFVYVWLTERTIFRTSSELIEFLKAIGFSLLAIPVATLYAAVFGALIMGAAAAISYRKPPKVLADMHQCDV